MKYLENWGIQMQLLKFQPSLIRSVRHSILIYNSLSWIEVVSEDLNDPHTLVKWMSEVCKTEPAQVSKDCHRQDLGFSSSLQLPYKSLYGLPKRKCCVRAAIVAVEVLWISFLS